MARNALGRELPETFQGRRVVPYRDPWSTRPAGDRVPRPLKRVDPGQRKLCHNLQEAIERCGLRDGMTIATHHHLRNGDYLLNHVVRMIDHMGLKDIRIASSSVHPVHAELVPLIREGVITGLECGVNGLIGELCSRGELTCPITVRSHGGRARAVASGNALRATSSCTAATSVSRSGQSGPGPAWTRRYSGQCDQCITGNYSGGAVLPARMTCTCSAMPGSMVQ